jgi:hypothetical protein
VKKVEAYDSIQMRNTEEPLATDRCRIHLASKPSGTSLLFYLAVCWPDEFDIRRYSAFVSNHMPLPSSHRAPIELLTGWLMGPLFLRRSHTFGCPVFVLDPRLQDGRKIPKLEHFLGL